MSRLSNMQDFNSLKTRMNGSFPLRFSSKKRFASQSLFLSKAPLKMQCRLVALKSLNLLAGKTCHPRIDCFAVALCIKFHVGVLCSLVLAKDVSFQVQNIKRTLQICISRAHACSAWGQEVIDACQVLLFSKWFVFLWVVDEFNGTCRQSLVSRAVSSSQRRDWRSWSGGLGKDVSTLMHVLFELHWLCLLIHRTGGVTSMFRAGLFFVKHICC